MIRSELDSEGAVQAQVSTTPDSPWFSGHFPGDPVLPGVAQLGMVVDCIEKALDKPLVLHQLARIKFKKIIRPGDLLDIRVIPGRHDDDFMFFIQHKEQDVCSGRIVLMPSKEQ